MSGPISASQAREYVERLREMAASRGAVRDSTDVRALRWAVIVCDERMGALEAEERSKRAEDDTTKLGPR